MGIIERIKEIEAEMARTQKNKATEYHLGQLKAKIAKLRTQLLEPPKGSSGAGDGFEVTKFGHGRVALIGFPSVGKSTLLTMLTGTHSEAASYEFTTLTCIPGIIHYNDTKIQLLDLPGIIEGASEGKGRGRQVIAVSKSSDIVLMVLDASKSGSSTDINKGTRSGGFALKQETTSNLFQEEKNRGHLFQQHFDSNTCRREALLSDSTRIQNSQCRDPISSGCNSGSSYRCDRGYSYIHEVHICLYQDRCYRYSSCGQVSSPAKLCGHSLQFKAQLSQTTCKNVGRNGACQSLHKTTRPATSFYSSCRSFNSSRRVHGSRLLQSHTQKFTQGCQVRASVGYKCKAPPTALWPWSCSPSRGYGPDCSEKGKGRGRKGSVQITFNRSCSHISQREESSIEDI
uniref:p-loop-containing nucleoside triphosphate hydrolase superfamily protein n=1 Tax=Populus tomentosa TaxID=118781 RepID=A0A1I9VZY4_POPTO|nr:P-loop-containing nucleoside triphosphate hydrolase superfamily protein [Populus tomentosa]